MQERHVHLYFNTYFISSWRRYSDINYWMQRRRGQVAIYMSIHRGRFLPIWQYIKEENIFPYVNIQRTISSHICQYKDENIFPYVNTRKRISSYHVNTIKTISLFIKIQLGQYLLLFKYNKEWLYLPLLLKSIQGRRQCQK